MLNENTAWKEQLHIEYDLILFSYRIKMQKPSLAVHNEDSYWGYYDHCKRLISLHRRLIEEYRWDDVIQILKHEMAHQYVREVLRQDDSTHGEAFQKACSKLGVADWAKRAGGSLRSPLKQESMHESPLMRKAEKLLALSRSENPHEANLALSKLQALSQKHNIHDFELGSTSKFTYLIVNHKKKRIPQHQSRIASLLQRYFFVDIVFSDEYDSKLMDSHKTMEIMGSRNNVEMAEYTYHFLNNQLNSLWKTEKKRGLSGITAKRAFFLGILESFENKLSSREQKEENSASLVEVNSKLSRYKQELEIFTHSRFPRLSKRSVSLSHRQASAYVLGRHEGSKLEIHKGLTRQNKTLYLTGKSI